MLMELADVQIDWKALETWQTKLDDEHHPDEKLETLIEIEEGSLSLLAIDRDGETVAEMFVDRGLWCPVSPVVEELVGTPGWDFLYYDKREIQFEIEFSWP